MLAVLALAAGGTLLPFTLFAFGQKRVSAEVAGAFLNLEPLVGAIAGAAAFGDPVGLAQIAGGAAIVAGIGLSSLPLLAGRRRPQAAPLAPALGGAGPLARADARPLAPALGGAGLAAHESGALPDRAVLPKSHTGPGGEASRLNVPPGRLEPAQCSTGPAERALESHIHGIPERGPGGEMGYLSWFAGGSLVRGRGRDRGVLVHGGGETRAPGGRGRGRAGGWLGGHPPAGAGLIPTQPLRAVEGDGLDRGGVAAGQLTVDGGFGLYLDVPDQGGSGRGPRPGTDVRLAAFKGE